MYYITYNAYDCTTYCPPFSIATGSYVCRLVGVTKKKHKYYAVVTSFCSLSIVLLLFTLDGYDNRSFLYFLCVCVCVCVCSCICNCWSAPTSCRRHHSYHLTSFHHHQQSLLDLLIKETITAVATDFIVNSLSLSLSLCYCCLRHFCHVIANENEYCCCVACHARSWFIRTFLVMCNVKKSIFCFLFLWWCGKIGSLSCLELSRRRFLSLSLLLLRNLLLLLMFLFGVSFWSSSLRYLSTLLFWEQYNNISSNSEIRPFSFAQSRWHTFLHLSA